MAMALIHWDPVRLLGRRDEVFEDLLRDLIRHPGENPPFQPAAEISETANDITVKLAVPGVEKEQLAVTVRDDVLTVRGEVRKESEDKRRNFYRQEIRYGAFERSVGLPSEVDGSGSAAELKNGMLRITLPKCAQPRAHQVKVAVA